MELLEYLSFNDFIDGYIDTMIQREILIEKTEFFNNISTEDRLVGYLSKELAIEIDREIINELMDLRKTRPVGGTADTVGLEPTA